MTDRVSSLPPVSAMMRAHGLEPKEMCFVSPKQQSIPNILLVHFVKGGGKELKFTKPLAVYDEDGNYTKELLEAYKD